MSNHLVGALIQDEQCPRTRAGILICDGREAFGVYKITLWPNFFVTWSVCGISVKAHVTTADAVANKQSCFAVSLGSLESGDKSLDNTGGHGS